MKPVATAWKRLEGLVGHKQARYSLVSVISVVISQIVLITCNAGLGWSGVTSNVTAVSIGAIPSYTLNRAWTWQKSGDHSFTREVLPFWVLAFLGLAISTGLVWLADRHIGETWAISAANLAGFGLLWIGKFVVLEKVLFRTPDHDTVDAEPVTAT